MRAGAHDLRSTVTGEQNVKAFKVVAHPEFDGWSVPGEHDVALVQLAQPLGPVRRMPLQAICRTRSRAPPPSKSLPQHASWRFSGPVVSSFLPIPSRRASCRGARACRSSCHLSRG
ncbi:trypsin-like serine protease [Streptomyces sp. NPDC052002]|uniref:trypsin-like serine protease n=1 Tax=Streptomyces sp. NPDC052002 TaxID=3155754 RepID=UPI00344B10CF